MNKKGSEETVLWNFQPCIVHSDIQHNMSKVLVDGTFSYAVAQYINAHVFIP